MQVQMLNPTAPKRLIIAASIAAMFTAFTTPALAVDMEDLVDKLREKGVLTEEEYQEMRTDVRAEKRKEALERANDEEKKIKKAESAPSELTGSFKDGFSWQTGDKQNSISVNGRVHADYRRFSPDNSGADTFDVRRAYLGVSGKLYNDWGYTVNADFGGLSNSSHLDVAHVDYNGMPVKIRAGQFKMPFSLEELTSSRFLDFQERGFGNGLVPGKERGLMLHGEITKGLVYGLAYSNGAGKNTNDTSNTGDGKDIIGRVAVNVAELLDNKNAIIHLGGAYSTGTIPTSSTAGSSFISGRTEGRGITFFNVLNTTLTGTDIERERKGAELVLAWNQIKLQSEFVTVSFSGTAPGGVGYDRDIESYYASLSWLITGEKYADAYKGGAFGAIKPNQAFKKGADGWGAWELGVRYSKWDAGDFATTNPAGTGLLAANTTDQADALTVGLKWIPNTNTRVYLNYIQTDFDRVVGTGAAATDDEKAITMRAAIFF